jgi:hypothetical protein
MGTSAGRQTKRHVLVVANGTDEGAVLHEVCDRLRGSEAEVLVVAPALGSRRRHRPWDTHEAWDDAEARLRRCLDLLDRAGIEANGLVGDADPLQAIAKVLYGFPADELVIATLPPAHRNGVAGVGRR